MIKMCEDCEKQHDGCCAVYNYPPHVYRSNNKCPFNLPKEEIKKTFVRIGQQKGRKKKR